MGLPHICGETSTPVPDDPEFHARASSLARAQLARDLGIHGETLHLGIADLALSETRGDIGGREPGVDGAQHAIRAAFLIRGRVGA